MLTKDEKMLNAVLGLGLLLIMGASGVGLFAALIPITIAGSWLGFITGVALMGLIYGVKEWDIYNGKQVK